MTGLMPWARGYGVRTPLREYLAYPRDPTEIPLDWPDVELERETDRPILSDEDLWRACARVQNREESQSHDVRPNLIRFSEDWDKLRDARFTTLRSYHLEKESFYRSRVGKPFAILLTNSYRSFSGTRVGLATLQSVSVVIPREMPTDQLGRDVNRRGKPDQQWLRRLLAMNRALLLEFENHPGGKPEGV